MTVAFVLLLLLAQVVAPPPQTGVPLVSGPPPPPDPATAAFGAEAGLILVAIKPASVADYELVMYTLQEALFADVDVERKAATKGWRVFKAAPLDAKGNTLYIHMMLPAVPAFDYRPSLLIDMLVKDLAPDLLSMYQDAFAGPPAKLDLAELANMAAAPLPAELRPPVFPTPGLKAPGNTTPGLPTPNLNAPGLKTPEIKKPEPKKPGL